MKGNLSVQKSLKETIVFLEKNFPTLIKLSTIPFFLMIISSSLYVLNGGSVVYFPLLFSEIRDPISSSNFIINMFSPENVLFLTYLVAYLLLARSLYEFVIQKNETQRWVGIYFDKKLAVMSLYFLLFFFIICLFLFLERALLNLPLIASSHMISNVSQFLVFISLAYLIFRGAFAPFLSISGSQNPLKTSFQLSRGNMLQLFLFYVTSIFLALLVSAGILVPFSIPLLVLSFLKYFPLQLIGAVGLILLQCASLLFFEIAITVIPMIAYKQLSAKR